MPRKPWTYPELQHLLRDYADTPTRDLAARLGRPIASVYAKAQGLGLKKSSAFLASPASGRLTGDDDRGKSRRFTKGLKPWNKGAHFTAGGRSAETRYKAGNRTGKAAQLHQPIGTERITKDGCRQRKVNDDMPAHRRWQSVQRLVWEEHRGPVPDGHVVTFRDGDKLNCEIDNLALVSRQELMSRNTVHNLPEELRQVVQLKGALVRQINKRSER